MQSRPLVNGREERSTRRTELVHRIARHVEEDGVVEAAPGLFLSRFSSQPEPIHRVVEPSFCIVAQGSKEILLGRERYRYDPSHYLLISAGLPLTGYVVEASKRRPCLGIRVVLDPAVIRSVLIEAKQLASLADRPSRALVVSRLNAHLLDAVLRLIQLVDKPNDYILLAPLVIREIIYRLSQGEQAARLCQMAVTGCHAHQIARAIEVLRTNYNKPLRIAHLARQVGMSTSGFHHNFKALTGMSPLECHKQFRLQEARRLLIGGTLNAATVGYRVGYEDPAYFGREYKRFFGSPPVRDTERLRSEVTS